MNKVYRIIIMIVVVALLSWSISCSGINNNSNTRDSESVLYMLQYHRYSGLYCYIIMQEEFLDIKMYINGEIVSERDAPGYTYIPLEYIPAELFELEVRIFNVNDQLIHQETYYNVSVINAEEKTKLEISSPDIEHLFIYNCKSIEDISALEETLKLKSLNFSSDEIAEKSIDLTSIENLTEMKVLDIYYCNIKNINALTNLKNLEFLNIGSVQVEDITALKDLKNLRYLVMHHNKISDISPLSDLTNLEYLQASSNNIENVESLRNMKKLKYLVLSSNKISDVEPLGEVVSLERALLANNRITDITPLAKLKNLKYLNLSGNEINDYSALDKAGIEYND